MTSPEVLFSLVKSLGYHVELHGDRIWLRHDVEDCDDETEEQHDKVWREYCEIQEDLRAHGYEIQYPAEIEHDCVSGDVVPYKAEPFVWHGTVEGTGGLNEYLIASGREPYEPVPITHRYQL